MPTHSEMAITENESERAPRSAVVVSSARACAVCGAALTGRPQQRCCSARCRATKSRRQRVPLPVAEAQAIRASLTMALEAVYDAKATLERYGE